jgi:hypothetical protein
MSDETNLLEERVARLESLLVRQDAKLHAMRWQRKAAVLFLGILGVALVFIPLSGAGPGTTSFDYLIAKQLILKDAKGKNRIILSTQSDNAGPALLMFDAVGRLRYSVALGGGDDGGPSMTFRDIKGHSRIAMGLSFDGTPGLSLADSAGRNRFTLVGDEAGHSDIIFSDANSKPNMLLGENADHKSYITLRSSTSKAQTKLETGENSTLVIDDAKGQTVFDAAKAK